MEPQHKAFFKDISLTGGLLWSSFIPSCGSNVSIELETFISEHPLIFRGSVVRRKLKHTDQGPVGAFAVAFTDAPPTPNILSASVSSPGNNGDPAFHSYQPDAGGYPVWKWDSSSFWACNRDNDSAGGAGTAIYYYTVGSSGGTVGVNFGFNPWYTISG